MAITHNIARWYLAVVFMFAGAAKLVQLSSFYDALTRTGFFAPREATYVAYALPPTEIVLSIMLILTTYACIRFLALFTIVLSICFVGVHGYAVLYGDIDCNCLGVALSSSVADWAMLVISLCMLAGANALLFVGHKAAEADDHSGPSGACSDLQLNQT